MRSGSPQYRQLLSRARQLILVTAVALLVVCALWFPVPHSASASCGPGGSFVVSSGGNTARVGWLVTTSSNQWVAQSFTPVGSGQLTQFSVRWSTNIGTPTGTVTWEVRADSSNTPSTVLQTGTFTVTQSSTMYINVSSGVILTAGTQYWLVLKPTSAQVSNNAWSISLSVSNPYGSGFEELTSDDGVNWTQNASNDIEFGITTSACATDTPSYTPSPGPSSTPTITQTPTITYTPSNTPTPTPNLYQIATLSTGQAVAVEHIFHDDTIIVILLLLTIVGLLVAVFGVLIARSS